MALPVAIIAGIIELAKDGLTAVLAFFGYTKDNQLKQAGADAQKLQAIDAATKEQDRIDATPAATDTAVNDSLRDHTF